MKLTDLIQALAEEVDLMRPQLDKTLSEMIALQSDDADFVHLLDKYNDYAVRMGEAAEMVGFTGLNNICTKVQENTLLLAVYKPDERTDLVAFLEKWPVLISEYLKKLSDSSVAAGLVDLFITAPSPFTEEEARKVMHQLGTMALKATNGDVFNDPDNQRQTQATPEDVDLNLPEDIDQRLMSGFLQESPSLASALVTWAQKLEIEGNILTEEIQQAKRYTHTLKGTGATIGAKGLASLGHHLEDILEFFEENPQACTPYLSSLVLDASYCMEQMVSYIAGDDEYPEQSLLVLQQLLDVANKIDKGESLASLSENDQSNYPYPNKSIADPSSTEHNSIADQLTSNNTTGKNNTEVTTTPKQTQPSPPKTALRVTVEKVDELFRVSGEISIHSSAMEDKIQALAEQTKQLLAQNIRVQQRLFELETLVDVRALSLMRENNSYTNPKSGFDPLEMDQYNELHSSAHALVEEAADARVVAINLEEQIATLSSMQSRQQVLSRDLQHLVISTRMSEIGELESRLQRNVRTTSQMTGKITQLVMSGQSTLIDSDVMNQMAEPLLHLIRNAIDHGIEPPETRVSKGKAEAGTIYLDFLRQGQQVILRCQDDGKGLDLEKIRTRAIENNLISPKQVLSEDEIAQLILRSGFSSRDTVTEVSGRGVGLDVVRAWVNTMNGSMSIRSGEHGGCLFELRFAASLSTIQSLIVLINQNYYAIPAVQIEQAVSNDLGKFDYVNKKFVYFYEDEVIPARMLADLINEPVSEKEFSEYYTVIVNINEKRYALAVDELFDSRELLMKQPGRYARHLKGVSGLSILGNGAIAVNLDLNQIIDHANMSLKKNTTRVSNQPSNMPKVLIVDDALTVRNSLQQLIGDIGFEAFTARDGIDAINHLKEITPDIVLTDLEMPNMNGVELTQHIRARNDISNIPIIMITSRSQNKHRQLADNAGVDEYLTKPYHDIQLIECINASLKASKIRT